MAKLVTFPPQVTDISDRDFWAALRPVRGREPAALLGEAIRLGRGGRAAEAYARLADYHRHVLAGEWDRIRAEHEQAVKPKPDTLRKLLRHEITAWHTQVIRFGPQIDWIPAQLPRDCVHGFHYFGWFRPAVTAFIQTGDPKWRAFIIDILDQYVRAQHDPRWKAQMPWLVFGMLGAHAKWPTFLASYLALINTGDVPADLAAGLLKIFVGFGRGLDHAIRKYIPGYNALCASNTDRLHLSYVFPEFADSAAWRRKGTHISLEHARKGFYADGGNRERVWGYGVMHLGALVDAYRIMHRYGDAGTKSRTLLGAIRRGAAWYAQTMTPDPAACFPTYGDAGWSTGDRMPTIRAMVKDLPGGPDATLGIDRTRSYLLEPSGFAILRNGNDAKSTYVNLNFGEFGGWHSHYDLLSMNLWAHGQPLLEELCRFGPYANPLDTLFRAPESHNQTLIDGMVYDCRNVKGEDVAWFSNEAVDYFSAYHRAYRYFCFGRDGKMRVSPNAEIAVRRTVVLVKEPGYVVVTDVVRNLNAASTNTAISQYWHSPQRFRQVGPDRARTQGRTACLLVYAQPDGLHRLDTGVDFAGKEVSHLGSAYERYSLRARRWMPINYKGNAGFSVVLYPFTGQVPAVQTKPLPIAGGLRWDVEAFEITTPAGRDVILLNPERRSGVSVQGHSLDGRARIQLGSRRGTVEIA